MAAKKKSAVGTVVTIGGGLLLVYIVYRWLTGSRSAQAAMLGGGGGGYVPNQQQQQAAQRPKAGISLGGGSGALGNMAKSAMQAILPQRESVGQALAMSGTPYGPNNGDLQSVLAGIFNVQNGWMYDGSSPVSDVNFGMTPADYSSAPIDYLPTQSFDFGNWSQSLPGDSGGGSYDFGGWSQSLPADSGGSDYSYPSDTGGYADTQDYVGDLSIG